MTVSVSPSFVPARPSAPFEALWQGSDHGRARFHGQVHCRRAEDGFLDPADGRERPREKGIGLDRGLAFPGASGGTSGERHLYYKAKGAQNRDSSAPLFPFLGVPTHRKENISNADDEIAAGLGQVHWRLKRG